MTNSIKDNFKVYIPADIIKSTTQEGVEEMRIRGVASDASKDSQDEYLDPSGFDLSQFRYLNWNHKAKDDPSTIIGEPDLKKCRVTAGNELYIEGILYPELDAAKATYSLMKALRNSPAGNKLSLSVEGKVLQRDPKNPKRILKSKITACALCPAPVNSNTWVDLIKGEMKDSDSIEYDIETEEIMKSVNISLRKSDIYDAIFKAYPEIEIEKAKSVYDLIQKISTMSKVTPTVSDETIKKAFDILGLASEEIVKGEGDNETEEVASEKAKNKSVVKNGTTKQDKEKLPVVEKAEDEDEKEEKDMTEKAYKHAKELKKAGKSSEEMGAKLLKKGYGYKVVEKAIMKAEAEGSEDEDTEGEKKNKEREDNESTESSAAESKAKKKNAGGGKEDKEDKENLNVTKSLETLTDLIKSQNDTFSKKFNAIGQLLKAQSDENEELKKSLDETLSANAALKNDVTKALSQPLGRKSILTKSFTEKFEKSEEGEQIYNINDKKDRKALSSRLMDLSGIEKSEGSNFNKVFTKIAQDLELTGGIEPRDLPALNGLGIKLVNY